MFHNKSEVSPIGGPNNQLFPTKDYHSVYHCDRDAFIWSPFFGRLLGWQTWHWYDLSHSSKEVLTGRANTA